MNQCWLIISGILWHSFDGNFTGNAPDIYPWYGFQNWFKITVQSPRGQWVNEPLTHWAWVTHICISNLTIIGSDNGLAPGRRQAIIWTNAGILLIGPLGTLINEIFITIHTFSFKKIHFKMVYGKCQPFCFSLNVLNFAMPPAPDWPLVTWAVSGIWPLEADPSKKVLPDKHLNTTCD